jgi:hypothetical protein
LKPIAKTAVERMTRKSKSAIPAASTLFQAHGTVTETEGQMSHAAPTTTLRYCVRLIH